MIKDEFQDREAKNYKQPIPSRECILELIKEKKSASKAKVVKYLKLDEEQSVTIEYRLKAMLRDGQLSLNRHKEFVLFVQRPAVTGKVIANPRGFGFVKVADGGKDLRLSPIQMQAVFHGETVVARQFDDRNGAKIEDITQRIKTLVGRLIIEEKGAYLQPDDKRIVKKILIPTLPKKYQHDQVVVTTITKYPTKKTLTEVKVKQLLGNYLDKGVEMQSALFRYGISDEFNKKTLEESESLPTRVLDKDKKGRVDLTNHPLITIDGEDSRDFDDAVCAKKEGKNMRLWVAIADVSHYVDAGSPLDKEATKRTTSVYFPSAVVPMLPEKISNGLCSLNPKVLRLCLTCELLIDPKGRVLSSEFYPGVMKSHARMTYTEVAKIVEDKDKAMIKKYEGVVYENILALDELYEILAKARVERGAMVFSRTESQILFDTKGKIKNIVAKFSNKAHRIIEECMLLANQSCAQFLDKHKQSFLYRVHPKPTDEKINNLVEFLAALDIDLPNAENITPKDFANLLDSVKGREDARLIQTMVLRGMKQAIYTSNNAGHFGLAFEQYTHFTSPIRRYPDLIAHRAIKMALNKEKPSKGLIAKVVKMGEICSVNERNADEASRDVEKWLKCEFMSHRLNKIYDGTISGVVNFGLFIELNDIFIDGMLPVQGLKDDYYNFDEYTQSLVGKTNNQVYALGDAIKVQVAIVDLNERKIELKLVD